MASNQRYYKVNQKSRKVWLEKGKHFARVDYRSNSSPSSYMTVYQGGSDWQANYFEISYYRIRR